MKILLCTPYLDTPDVVSSGIGIWARNIMSYNQETDSDMEIVPVSFDRHTHIEEYTVGGFKRYYSGIKEVGRCVKNAIRKIRTEKPDAVHICTSGSFGFIKDIILARAARRRGIKSIVHCHFGRIPEIVGKKGFEQKLLKIVLGLADTVIVIDGKSYEALGKLHYNNIAYIPNPLSVAFLREAGKQADQTTREAGTALFVGHVVPTKGVFELVESCCKVSGLSLRIIGKCNNEMRQKLLSMAAKRDDGAWLHMVGEVPHSEVAREMLRADAFIFPSHTEGFPNVILEAMACGCAIVTTAVGAIPEMLEEDGSGKYGLLVAPEKADKLEAAIVSLMGDEGLKAEIRKNARRRVVERYSMSTIWKQLNDVWENGCNG